ncbi:MAG: cytochrome c family protein [Oceanicaulis sp.]|uniref:c-type cytochrome n=1 Tax=Glycocaulis sp. TaxID=1969725 RepID=UPI0025BEC372|nr:cytochrome c family protein [Glycocaulis sp.]MCC5981446.1 cytochrome c family protein [Oceanicaulis sp.]MCH8521928.1 cytochrome c family protein [Glycocaulis sp.]
MGDLFWNKVAGAVLAILLVVMGLREIGDIVFDVRPPETLGFPIDPALLEGPATAGVEEDAGPVDFGALLATASVDAGERVARRCVACHTFEQGGAHGTGPNMWGIMGRTVASISGFNYSSAMREYGADGTEWLYQNMYDYLAAPRRYVPGTSMAFAGLRSQDDRINLLAYMRQMASDPLPIPEPLPEEPELAVDPEEPAPVGTADAGYEGELVEGAGPLAQPGEDVVTEDENGEAPAEEADEGEDE